MIMGLTRAERITGDEGRPCLVVLQLYLEDLEVKVIPVDKSPPSLSSS